MASSSTDLLVARVGDASCASALRLRALELAVGSVRIGARIAPLRIAASLGRIGAVELARSGRSGTAAACVQSRG